MILFRGMLALDGLLIEPMWNRNHLVESPESQAVSASFNRTNVESKRPELHHQTHPQRSFNRTNMESKLVEHLKNKSMICHLLIEPFWNRNNCLHSLTGYATKNAFIEKCCRSQINSLCYNAF